MTQLTPPQNDLEATFQNIIKGPVDLLTALNGMNFDRGKNGPDYYRSLDSAFGAVDPDARNEDYRRRFRTAINTLIDKKVPLKKDGASRIISRFKLVQDSVGLSDNDLRTLQKLIDEYSERHGEAALSEIGATEEWLVSLGLRLPSPANNPTSNTPSPTPTPTNVPTNAPTPQPEQQSFWDKEFLGLSVRAWAWILGGLLVGGLAYGAFRKGGWLNKDKKKTASVSSTTPKSTLPPYNEELGMAHLRTATQSHTSSTNSNPLVNSGTIVTPERPFRTTALLGANEKSNS